MIPPKKEHKAPLAAFIDLCRRTLLDNGYITPEESEEIVWRQAERGMLPEPPEPPKPVESRQYPQFYRNGDVLVKIGWCRTLQGEYRHRVSKDAFGVVVATLIERGSQGRPIRLRDLHPLVDPQGRPLQGSRLYDSVAWIKSLGLLQKHGHKGYTLTSPSPRNLASIIESHWKDLPNEPREA